MSPDEVYELVTDGGKLDFDRVNELTASQLELLHEKLRRKIDAINHQLKMDRVVGSNGKEDVEVWREKTKYALACTERDASFVNRKLGRLQRSEEFAHDDTAATAFVRIARDKLAEDVYYDIMDDAAREVAGV